MKSASVPLRLLAGVSLAVLLAHGSDLGAAADAQDARESPPRDAGAFGKGRFEEMDRAHRWKEVFFDAGTSEERTVGWREGAWMEKWFLDGEIGAVSNELGGMNLAAGPRWRDDAHHMVLWTKPEFAGDLKIEYEFTRTDIQDTGSVILIYIQATGEGSEEYPLDIAQWSDKRSIPSMGQYFKNMHLYHISYSTGNPFLRGDSDYIRARRYMPGTDALRGTELPQEYANTGLFRPGVTYRITIIKEDFEIAMRVERPDEEARYFWFKNEKFPAITHGRIGLRHMFTRSARYKDFRVSEAEHAEVR